MAMTFKLFAPILPSRQFSCTKSQARKRVSSFPAISAMRRESDYPGSGRSVDEDMIVLRMRIHEMKMMEENYEPPAGWMEWEKRVYTNYDSVICVAMGVLQSHLMNCRPSLALGVAALVAFSVPTSTFLVLYHLKELFTNGVLGGIHFG